MTDSFVFYRSFYESMAELSDAERLELMDAICEYVLNDNEVKLSSVSTRALFRIIKETLKSNVEKQKNGLRGGRPASKKPVVSEQKTNGLQNKNHRLQKSESTATATDNATVTDNAADAALENAAAASAEDPRLDTALAQIIRRYEEDIGSFPRSALDGLQRWRRVLGDELVGLAIGEAAENNARSWRYVDRVLSSWEKEGVRTAGDVQARRDRKASPADADTGPHYRRAE